MAESCLVFLTFAGRLSSCAVLALFLVLAICLMTTRILGFRPLRICSLLGVSALFLFRVKLLLSMSWPFLVFGTLDLSCVVLSGLFLRSMLKLFRFFGLGRRTKSPGLLFASQSLLVVLVSWMFWLNFVPPCCLDPSLLSIIFELDVFQTFLFAVLW